MLDEVIENTWPLVDPGPGPGQSPTPYPSSVLEIYIQLFCTVPTMEEISRTKPQEHNVLLRPSGLVRD